MVHALFYFLSFLPLWVAILFIDGLNWFYKRDDHLFTEWISIALIIFLSVVSIIFQEKFLQNQKIQNIEEYGILKAREDKIKISDYLVAYVIPLLAFDFTKWYEAALFVFIFSILGVHAVHHNIFQSNLILECKGYRIYECELLSGKQTIGKYVVSKIFLNEKIGKKIRTKKINNDYHLEGVISSTKAVAEGKVKY